MERNENLKLTALTTSEVMQRYSMCRSTLYERIRDNKFPRATGKIGKSLCWSLRVLQKFDAMIEERSLSNYKRSAVGPW